MGAESLVGILLAVAAIVVGVAAVSFPLAFPKASVRVHRVIFLGGLAVALLLVLAAILIANSPRPKPPPEKTPPPMAAPVQALPPAVAPAPRSVRRHESAAPKAHASAPDRAKLLAFAAEGDALRGRWKTEDSDELLAETEAWGRRVGAYLDGLGEKTRSTLFLSDLGFTATQYADPDRKRAWMASNWLERRLFQLDRLISAAPGP